MENFTNGNGTNFWKGAFIGFVTFGGIFFPADIGVSWWIAGLIKIIFTSAVAGASGFATILITDYYKFKIKNKLFKTKKDKENEKDEEKVA